MRFQPRRGAVAVFACVWLLAWSAAADGPGDELNHDFVGYAKCKTCHKKELMGNQIAAWQQGPHHRAFETLKNAQSQAIAAERGLSVPPHQAEECLSCHVTAHDIPDGNIAYPIDPADGVQCESCHGPGRDYRKKKIMSDLEVAREKGLWDAVHDELICLQCHNPQSPTYDPSRYQLPDGTSAGFDFDQARSRIGHAIPEHVKGNFLQLEKEEKARKKAAGK